MNNYSEFEEENEKQIDFRSIFFNYLSYWKWIIVSLIICLVLAELYLKTTLPTYEATTSILLKDDQKGGGTPELNAFKEMGLLNYKNNVDNELEMLKTSTLMEQVVHELGMYTSYKKISSIRLFDSSGSHDFGKIRTYKDKMIYGSECPILIQLPNEVLDTLSVPIKFEVMVYTNGVYEFSGVFKKKKY